MGKQEWMFQFLQIIIIIIIIITKTVTPDLFFPWHVLSLTCQENVLRQNSIFHFWVSHKDLKGALK